MAEVSDELLQLAAYVVGQELDRRRRFGHPIPPVLRNLETALGQAMSANGPPPRPTTLDSSRLKTTADLAAEWQCTTRTVRRRAAASGAEKVGGRWLFDQ